jgi:hypothetical protein
MVKKYKLDKSESRWETCFRAYASHFPEGVWPEPAESLERLSLDAPVLIVSATEFAHVPLNPKKQGLPSASPALQSLARAVAEADAKLFKPGTSNTHPS